MTNSLPKLLDIPAIRGARTEAKILTGKGFTMGHIHSNVLIAWARLFRVASYCRTFNSEETQIIRDLELAAKHLDFLSDNYRKNPPDSIWIDEYLDWNLK